jgi:hypothetical protein
MTSGVTMAGSGIEWIDGIFNVCVLFLVWVADNLNITYEEVNVWLFCLLWPTLTVYQTLRIIYLKWRLG